MPATISLASAITFALSIILQVTALYFLPMSRGFTNLTATAMVLICFGISFYLFSRLIVAGVQLSVLLPASAALVPLGAIAIGVLVYGEPAPLPKIALLCLSAVIIGGASLLK
jgi:multidrug transporter EmrE-like cation transporter